MQVIVPRQMAAGKPLHWRIRSEKDKENKELPQAYSLGSSLLQMIDPQRSQQLQHSL